MFNPNTRPRGRQRHVQQGPCDGFANAAGEMPVNAFTARIVDTG